MVDDTQVRFCLRCGQKLERRVQFGGLRPVCPACNYTHFFDPKVAAAVWAEQVGQVLLVRRAMEPARGHWTVPGGFVDAGEDPAKAAVRECEEETGLKVGITSLLDVVSGREHERGADFVIFYRATIEGGDLRACDDVDRVDWFGPEEIPQLAFKATHVMVERWLTGKFEESRG